MSMFKVRLNVRFAGWEDDHDRVRAAEHVLNFIADVDSTAAMATTADPETFAFFTVVSETTDQFFAAAEAASGRVREAVERADLRVRTWPDSGELPWGVYYKSIEVDRVDVRALAGLI